MQLVTGWVEQQSGRWVALDREIVERFQQYRQASINDAEAGGLLLGIRRGQHIEVKWLTVPEQTDTRRRFGFFREILGHAAKALSKWIDTVGQADYVGEWHTHPEPHPQPSATDISEWRRLASSRIDARPLIFIIVGTESFYACLCSQESIFPLTPIEYVQ